MREIDITNSKLDINSTIKARESNGWSLVSLNTVSRHDLDIMGTLSNQWTDYILIFSKDEPNLIQQLAESLVKIMWITEIPQKKPIREKRSVPEYQDVAANKSNLSITDEDILFYSEYSKLSNKLRNEPIVQDGKTCPCDSMQTCKLCDPHGHA